MAKSKVSDRLMPYVSVTKRRGVSVLCVESCNRTKTYYPLTEADCRLAGKQLYEAGVQRWAHSSSVNHADEYGFDGDVNTLIEDGMMEAATKANAPHRSMIAKMFAHCEQPNFQRTLTDEEVVMFKAAKKSFEEDVE